MKGGNETRKNVKEAAFSYAAKVIALLLLLCLIFAALPASTFAKSTPGVSADSVLAAAVKNAGGTVSELPKAMQERRALAAKEAAEAKAAEEAAKEEAARKAEEEAKRQREQAKAQIPQSSIVTREKGVSDKLYAEVVRYYEKAPGRVRESLEQSGFKVMIVSSNLSKRSGHTTSILAYTDFSEKVIYIDNRSAAASAVLHEIGHFTDFCSPLASIEYICSDSEDFSAIYAEETAAFRSFWKTAAANTGSTQEYFAESFECYVTQPKALKKSCPKTYAYITEIVNSFS